MCEEEDEGKDCLSLELTRHTVLAPSADLICITANGAVATTALRDRTRQILAFADRTSRARCRACLVAVRIRGADDAGVSVDRSRHI